MIIAIDPGKSGGIAWQEYGDCQAQKMPPTLGDMIDLLTPLCSCRPATVYLELVGGYIAGKATPGSAMFNFGQWAAYPEAICQTLGARIIKVRPQKWQAALGLHRQKDWPPVRWKNHLKAEAQRRRPGLKVTLATADAVLILEYAIERERTG